jgi:monoamine oxidase
LAPNLLGGGDDGFPAITLDIFTSATNAEEWDSPPLKCAPTSVELFDFVVCTIPFGVLRGMPIEGLSHQKMRAIRNLNYAASTKVLLHCDDRFWERGPEGKRILGGASMSDAITRSTYYPSDHAGTHASSFADTSRKAGFRGLHTTFALQPVKSRDKDGEPGPGVLLGSYNWGRDARRLGALAPDERAEVVLKVLEKIHPEIRNHVDDHASICWQTFRWSWGAFAFLRPGDLRDYYHDAVRPEGRLHFAGEHCSLDQAWMQGAISSGLRAVEEIVSA